MTTLTGKFGHVKGEIRVLLLPTKKKRAVVR
eukprot:CAMPEP_0197829794 /NCGR_PEP_ID=MMETSP1437-20131217/6342_1 /TAXON_ID=49252 ORGANISM="Eucampia antarctica, Strain CCMP1452" /NCGR_SAMPLE_ID=MMETSP1437 /ASSEMBLY_ACC=CAM_ASM_001096 /LENGTH=30 /DNA_ID= /DNA_START= /DNA_END= /DNA_ORIENTATION=